MKLKEIRTEKNISTPTSINVSYDDNTTDKIDRGLVVSFSSYDVVDKELEVNSINLEEKELNAILVGLALYGEQRGLFKVIKNR